MKIKLNKKQITEITTAMNHVVPRKSGLPVLGHVRFEVGAEGQVSVAATDLEQTLVLNVTPEKLECTGNDAAFLLPFDELKELKKAMKKADVVTLEPANDDGISLVQSTPTGDLARYVPSMPVDEFPMDPEPMELVECDLGKFMPAFRNVAFSASSNETRLALTGVYADPEKNVLVATDGRRMTTRELDAFPIKNDGIIPVSKTLMKTILDTGVGRIGITSNDNGEMFEIQTDSMRYVTRCIPGTYPNYQQVVPGNLNNFRTSVHFMDADLDALKTILPHLKSDSDRTLFLSTRNEGAAVGMESGDAGCCAIALPACRFDGPEPVTFCVNGELLAEALDHGFRHMKVRDGKTPLHFRDDNGGTHLLMPLRYETPKTLDLEFQKVFDGLPKVVKTTEPEPTPVAPEPQPETINNPESQEEKKTMTEQTKTTPKNNGLTMVESTDPIAALESFADTARDAVKQADQAIRELKKQVRTVKSHYRDREKDLNAREKDMSKSLTLLNKLQDSLAA
jgi:DNA polymerase III sliding clamp (beta) subunit (PCNA family)